MNSEIKKSINSILYERATSPLYGTFIISWVIWNWKIVYLTLFIDKDTIIPNNKIEYIISNYSCWVNIILFPIISTIVLITLIPYIANKAYWVYLFYEGERRKLKEKSDGETRLTLEQSAAIRNEIAEQAFKSEKSFESKALEINLLETQISLLTEEKNKFLIVYARYGKYTTYIEVTKVVSDLLSGKGSFNVDNETLGVDPIRFKIKDLYIEYRYNMELKSISASEDETVELNDFKLSKVSNEKSKEKQLWLENQSKLNEIFKGEWTLIYTKDNKSISEKVKIDEFGNYFANDVDSFDLVVTELNDKRVVFNKHDSKNGELHSVDTLEIISDSLLTGTDDKEYSLEYKKN